MGTEISKKVTDKQNRFLDQLEYCTAMVSDVLLPNIQIFREELEIGNTGFNARNDHFVLLDVETPYKVDDVKVSFKVEDSGFAILRFTFETGSSFVEFDYSGWSDIDNDAAELELVKFLISLGGKLDSHSGYLCKIPREELQPTDFSAQIAEALKGETP